MPTCQNAEHRPFWVVVARKCNHSAFNGGRRTPSDYSAVMCTGPGCLGSWRTKAAYVDALPDACTRCDAPAGTTCRICRQPLCAPCRTDHHHEAYGTPATDTR